jgi:D-sedoheptulose 7-phosphate isomerase
VLEALRAARTVGMTTIALTGRDGGAAGPLADVHVNVPSDATPRIQEVHRTLLHVICDLVESDLAQA